MRRTDLEQILNAIKNFKLEGKVRGCIPYGNGHINDTFLIVTDDKKGQKCRYILQSVNNNVFKEPVQVMKNIEKVTEYLKGIVSNPREVLNLVPTYNGSSYYMDRDGYCWRIYDFVTNAICVERPDDMKDFYQCAVAFGKFQRYLTDFPADTLYETIPDFHNTPKRYNDFLNAVEKDVCSRAAGVQNEIKFLKERKDFYSILLDRLEEGKLPLRVSHNDTKSNNVMLDAVTHEALCVIDLDTIMPGFSVTDFGDAIRFGASTAEEDETDLSKVSLDVNMFEIYTKGFLEGCGGELPVEEVMLLPEGAKMMTIECGMRFLTDYLQGDTYFKTEYAEHNLARCRTQFKLVQEMEKHWDELKSIVEKYCKR